MLGEIMKYKPIILSLLLLVSVIAACPPGCEERGSYCDCLSNTTSVMTNCTSDLNCEEGYVCVNGVCVLAGQAAGVSISTPEFDLSYIILMLFFVSFIYLLRYFPKI